LVWGRTGVKLRSVPDTHGAWWVRLVDRSVVKIYASAVDGIDAAGMISFQFLTQGKPGKLVVLREISGPRHDPEASEVRLAERVSEEPVEVDEPSGRFFVPPHSQLWQLTLRAGGILMVYASECTVARRGWRRPELIFSFRTTGPENLPLETVNVPVHAVMRSNGVLQNERRQLPPNAIPLPLQTA
jgi:hypothetical protein